MGLSSIEFNIGLEIGIGIGIDINIHSRRYSHVGETISPSISLMPTFNLVENFSTKTFLEVFREAEVKQQRRQRWHQRHQCHRQYQLQNGNSFAFLSWY